MQIIAQGSLRFLRQGESYVGLEPVADGGYRVRTAALIPQDNPFSEKRTVLAIFPVSERLSSLADAVQRAYSDYGELSYMRRLLKYRPIPAAKT